jgi:broad specificity phosphatase PhoE
LGRARETASIIGQIIGLEPVPLEDLREMNFGWLEGGRLFNFAKRTSKNKFRHCEEGDLPDEAISFTIWGLLREEHPRNDDQNGKLFLHVC